MRRRYLQYGLISLAVIATVIAVLRLRPEEMGGLANANGEKPVVYVQRGFPNAVPTVAWSQDGRHILLSNRGTVLLFDAAGRELRRLELPYDAGAPVAFLPDGERFLVGGSDSSVQLRDIATFRELKRYRTSGQVRAIALSSQGDEFLSASTSPVVHLWDVKSGRELRRFPTGPAGSLFAALSEDGRLLLIQGTVPRTITLWNAENGRKVSDFEMSAGTPMCGAFSPDGRRIACGSGDWWSRHFMSMTANFDRSFSDAAEIRVWSTVNRQMLCSLRPDSAYAVLQVQFDPDGRRLMSTAVDSSVKWWDLDDCSLSSQLRSQEDLAMRAVISADGQRLLTAGDQRVRIWDIAGKQVIHTFPPKVLTDWVTSIPGNGKKIYVAPWWNGTPKNVLCQNLLVWDAQTCRRIGVLDPKPGKHAYAFSDDCQRAMALVPQAQAHDSLDFQFWSADRGLLGKPERTAKNLSGPWGWTRDGRYAAAGVDDSLYVLWQTYSGDEVRRIRCTDPPWAWSGRLGYLSLSDDGMCGVVMRPPAGLILNFSTGRSTVIRSSRDSTARIVECGISGDGRMAVFTWEDHSVDVWDAASLRLLNSYIVEGFGDSKGTIGWIKISRDNRRFVASRWPWTEEYSVNESGTIDTNLFFWSRVAGMWDLETGNLLQEFGKNTGGVYTLRFSNDEQLVIGSTADGGSWIFNAQTGKEIVHLLSFENGEWLAVTPEGYYTASLDGDAFLNVRKGTQITSMTPYRSTFYQPKVVEMALRLRDSEAAIGEVLGCHDTCMTISDLPNIEPPMVLTRSPANGDTLRLNATMLACHVEDLRYPIQSVKVFVNGRPVAGGPSRVGAETSLARGIHIEIPENQRSLDLKVPVRLDDGDNLITVTALGKSEAVDTLHVFVLPEGIASRMDIDTVWILAVGVNKYQNEELPSLSYASNDAQAMVRAFEAQEGKTCRKVMSRLISDPDSLKPTSETIVDNLDFLHQAKEEDLAVLFLAGHGMNDSRGDFYFLPSDAELRDEQGIQISKAISGAQLQAAVDVGARRFVFIDACQSEGMVVDLVRLSREFKENRVLVMSSSEGAKLSMESDSLKHGFFTYALVEGLRGAADVARADGKVSATELITYVSDRVTALTHQRQNPIFWAPGGLSNFVVAVNPRNENRTSQLSVHDIP